MADSLLSGSICLTDIPKELIKTVTCRDGKVRKYLNVSVITKKTPQTFTNNGVPRTYTHFISCSPRKEERREGVNYILGDLETKVFNTAPQPMPAQPAPAESPFSSTFAAPADQAAPVPPAQNDDLPF